MLSAMSSIGVGGTRAFFKKCSQISPTPIQHWIQHGIPALDPKWKSKMGSKNGIQILGIKTEYISWN